MPNRLAGSHDLGLFQPSIKKQTHEFVKGDIVIFDPLCTCEGCKMVEQWYLKRGDVFTVKEIIKKDCWVTIELKEVPEKFFASVMFLKKKN